MPDNNEINACFNRNIELRRMTRRVTYIRNAKFYVNDSEADNSLTRSNYRQFDLLLLSSPADCNLKRYRVSNDYQLQTESEVDMNWPQIPVNFETQWSFGFPKLRGQKFNGF